MCRRGWRPQGKGGRGRRRRQADAQWRVDGVYESPCTASGSLRPDVGTQSLAVSMLERFDTSLFTRQHAVAATAKATKAAINPAMATAPAFSTSDFFAPFLEPPEYPRWI